MAGLYSWPVLLLYISILFRRNSTANPIFWSGIVGTEFAYLTVFHLIFMT